ncbi:MAG: class I SAM-dependent methyltransferase, partial [Pseudomonadota bacterium]
FAFVALLAEPYVSRMVQPVKLMGLLVVENEHIKINQDHWNTQALDWVASGEKAWRSARPYWGNFGIDEGDVNMLPADMTDMTAIELGCGTGYVAAWMARRGAQVTGVDLSEAQLATAKRLRQEHGLDITFRLENAEHLSDAPETYDFAISEYGAAIWCAPDKWLAEAFRVLKPDGRLVFMGHHPLSIICTDTSGDTTLRSLEMPYRDMGRMDWSHHPNDAGGVEFNLTISDWFACFKRIGFVIEVYIELYAPDDAQGDEFSIPADWAKDFPAEQVWKLRKPEN